MLISKRRFIRNSFVGAVGLTIPWNSFADSVDRNVSPRKFKMLLNGGLIGVQTSQPALNDLAFKYGFEAVTASSSYLKRLSPTQLTDLREEMSQKQLTFGLGLLNLEFRKRETDFKQVLEQLPEDARALMKAGVSRVGTYIMSNHEELNYLQNFKLHTSRLKQLAQILAEYNIRLGLEYVGPRSIWSANRFPFLHTMSELRELIHAIDQPNVGIHLDTAHWFTAGEGIDSILSLKNQEVVGCDINDALPGIDPIADQPGYHRELPATTGVINLKDFLNALKIIGYDGFIQAEPFNADLDKLDDEEAVQKTAASMKKALALIS